METLLRLFHQIRPLSDELMAFLQTALITKEVKKNDYLLRAGHISTEIFYVEYGLFMGYYELKEKWITSWFMGAGEVIASPSSFFSQSVSYENIIALTAGRVHYVSFATLEHIYAVYPEFNVHGRILVQKYYQMADERNYMIKTRTVAERYEYLERHHPEWILQIPNKYLAAYLGTTESTLSRIRQRRTRQ